MLKNVLLASAAAFVVFGSAASLTNMKAVITSGNSAEASLTHDALDLNAKLADLRVEQARQSALLSVQDSVINRLQRDLQRVERSGGATTASMVPDEEWDIGLDLPSAAREKQAVAYFVAWNRALDGEAELASKQAELAAAETRYQDLKSASQERLTAMEASTADRVAALQSAADERVARAEAESKFEINRLKEEVEQRDSSIVGLMHRLVSLQTGTTPGAVADERPAPTPAKVTVPAAAKPEKRVESRMPAERQAKASPVQPAVTAPAAPEREASASKAAGNQATLADGVAAYQAGEYHKAFEIWRQLANAGDANARFHLGALYYEGRGVDRDLATAHLLLSMAVKAGHSGAQAMLSRVEADMTAAQLAALPSGGTH